MLMQISNNTNAPKFKGIFVKYNSFDEINTVARMLKYNGYTRLGYKDCYVPNGKHFYMQEKARKLRKIGLKGYENEFGVVNFPWLKQACFIAAHKIEPDMCKMIQRILPDAKLDMFA